MSRKMSAVREGEFSELREFLRTYMTDIKGVAAGDPIHPNNVLEDVVNRFGRSKAFDGLKQAIGDAIDETQRLSPAEVAKMDRYFRDRGVVTLSQLRARYWSKYASILKRGHIRDDTEYYLIVGVLADLSGPTTDLGRIKLQNLVGAYEALQA